jgi:hypothetical protein
VDEDNHTDAVNHKDDHDKEKREIQKEKKLLTVVATMLEIKNEARFFLKK